LGFVILSICIISCGKEFFYGGRNGNTIVVGNVMKSLLYLSIGLFTLTSCDRSTTDDRKSYFESQPTFFQLRHGDWLTNKWIRKPENLLQIHETFKKVGYDVLLARLSNNPVIFQDIYINKNGRTLIDSLVLTYKHRKEASKYYREFWARREKEQNDSAVFVILSDIQYSARTKMTSGILQMQADNSKVNDTLKSLLQIEYRGDTLTRDLALQDFTLLKKLGFHQSAYNLVFENYKYQDVKWKRDSLINTLKQSDKFVDPWIRDDTK
jgi:hypothetical protein